MAYGKLKHSKRVQLKAHSKSENPKSVLYVECSFLNRLITIMTDEIDSEFV